MPGLGFNSFLFFFFSLTGFRKSRCVVAGIHKLPGASPTCPLGCVGSDLFPFYNREQNKREPKKEENEENVTSFEVISEWPATKENL